MDALVDSISRTTLEKLESYIGHIAEVNPQLLDGFLTPARSLLSGGKRVRGLLSVAGAMVAGDDVTSTGSHAIEVASALEIFQGAALVHDDIMDESPTRRGQPAVHMRFREQFHTDGLVGDDATFGRDAGICSGDFLLAIATNVMMEAGSLRALKRFQDMCSEVAYGQYLDVRAENIDLKSLIRLDESEARAAILQARDNAFAVLRHKSAHYSVRDPLLIGADAAGANEQTLAGLAAIGSPLGEAFQLRDDALGIAGDPASTGKPTGGDLREGKRTVLLLTALAATVGTSDAHTIVEGVGTDLSDTDVSHITQLMIRSGAWQEHEELIASREHQAREAWQKLPDSPGQDLLGELMEKLTVRVH